MLPLVLIVSIGLPMLMACELPTAIVVLRTTRRSLGRRHLSRLRRELRQLPETRHPLNR